MGWLFGALSSVIFLLNTSTVNVASRNLLGMGSNWVFIFSIMAANAVVLLLVDGHLVGMIYTEISQWSWYTDKW